jgi:hypothetical protein
MGGKGRRRLKHETVGIPVEGTEHARTEQVRGLTVSGRTFAIRFAVCVACLIFGGGALLDLIVPENGAYDLESVLIDIGLLSAALGAFAFVVRRNWGK